MSERPDMSKEAARPWDHPYEADADRQQCIHCGEIGSYAHTREFYEKYEGYPTEREERTEARLAEAERLLGEMLRASLPGPLSELTAARRDARAFLAPPETGDEACDYCRHPVHRDNQCTNKGCMCAGEQP